MVISESQFQSETGLAQIADAKARLFEIGASNIMTYALAKSVSTSQDMVCKLVN
jgi:hypothetical protein